MFYPKCEPGYHSFGCCICVADGEANPELTGEEEEEEKAAGTPELGSGVENPD